LQEKQQRQGIMKTIYPLKVQSIRTRGQKQRPYVYLPGMLAEAVGFKSGELVEWELVSRDRLRLARHGREKADDDVPEYPLKVQTIRSKAQKPRLYINIPVPFAAAIRIRHGEPVQWEHKGDSLFIVRNVK
jgi:antitoxin component of MazEF toxin-antitoxin module